MQTSQCGPDGQRDMRPPLPSPMTLTFDLRLYDLKIALLVTPDEDITCRL